MHSSSSQIQTHRRYKRMILLQNGTCAGVQRDFVLRYSYHFNSIVHWHFVWHRFYSPRARWKRCFTRRRSGSLNLASQFCCAFLCQCGNISNRAPLLYIWSKKNQVFTTLQGTLSFIKQVARDIASCGLSNIICFRKFVMITSFVLSVTWGTSFTNSFARNWKSANSWTNQEKKKEEEKKVNNGVAFGILR